jgi:hypothetical protein
VHLHRGKKESSLQMQKFVSWNTSTEITELKLLEHLLVSCI